MKNNFECFYDFYSDYGVFSADCTNCYLKLPINEISLNDERRISKMPGEILSLLLISMFKFFLIFKVFNYFKNLFLKPV